MNASASELKKMEAKIYRGRKKILPLDIYDSIKCFTKSKFIEDILTKENRDKYISLKIDSADRCAKAFGTRVKAEEVLFHHEVTNQLIWDNF